MPLEGLRLATNFRSRAGIVEWVNATFVRVFRAAEDAESGAVAYAAASAHHPEEAQEAARWHAFVGEDAAAAREEEARTVALLAGEALRDPAASVAVLVRNRSHLDRVVPALKAAGIRFRAVDIEPLGARPVVQDLLALARALSHPADRIAWLALLRAPWCALPLADLHALAAAAPAQEGGRALVWEELHDERALARLGADARAAAQRLREALAPWMACRSRARLRERVEGAWLALGGPACAAAASDLDDAEAFFEQLDALEHAAELPDPTVLEEHLEALHAAPDAGEEARLQLMTIHKAKGLEFDAVIVPGLDRVPRAAERPLFAWKARPDGALMMAPVRAAGEASEPAYDYLCALDQEAVEHEAERLLYVAATRAVRRLHLLGFARAQEKGGAWHVRAPSARSLLGKAWSAAEDAFARALARARTAPAPARAQAPEPATLRVLDPAVLTAVAAAAPAVALPAPPSESPPAIEFSWVGETARHVGIVAHGWLQRIALEGLARWDAPRVAALAPALARELARRGVPPQERPAAVARVLDALAGAISDPRGRWVLGQRADARCEYRLRVPEPGGVRLLVIDRTFRDEDGRRWIVDYKTGGHEGGDLESFLDRELERYADQLDRYAAAFAGEDVGLGLYFPLVRGWRERR